MLGNQSETTGDLLMMAARMVRRRFAVALTQFEVTPAHARALRTLNDADGLRLSALAEQLRIAPRSATDLVDALEQRDLVVRQPDPADRRATVVRLSPHGVSLLTQINATRRSVLQGFTAEMSAEDQRELDRLLRAVLVLLSDDDL